MITDVKRRPRTLPAAAVLAGLAVLGAGSLAGCSSATAPVAAVVTTPAGSAQGASSSAKQAALYSAMSDLWEQHMEWTYATVVAFATDPAALTASLDRLLQNQADIGNAIVPFYGQAAGGQLTALLKTHIDDAVPVLTAAKDGNSAALNTAVAAWYANAQQIADFLAGANPNFPKARMEEMMKTHITQTIAYTTDVLKGDFPQAVADYGTAEAHMQQMANMLSQGLVAQFPAKFS